MEAARVAATRGHEVTLYEKESKLGGMIQLAGLVKGYELEDLTELVRYWEIQLKKLGVKVKLGTEFTPALISMRLNRMWSYWLSGASHLSPLSPALTVKT